MIGFGAVPALLQLIGLFFIPESPAWLKKEFSYQSSWRNLLNPIFRTALIAGLFLSIFQQITGINAVIYFAPRIFQDAGFSTASGAILATVGIGVINVIATVFSLWLIDKAGRRPLLFWSLSGMVVSLLVIAIALFTESPVIDTIAIFSLMAYVASFAIGMGPIPWLINAEIYPIAIRGHAMSLAAFVNWLSNYLVALTFLDLAAIFGTGSTFCLYAFLCLIALWFIAKRIPETKGKPLEVISKSLQ
jgi:MFS family permease